MIFILRLRIFFALTGTAFLYFAYPVHAYVPCDYDTNGRVTSTTVSESANHKWCLATPQAALITIDYLGLCKTEPTVSNYATVCEPLIPLGASKAATIKRGQAQDLVDQISISEGVYKYAAVLITNEIQHKSIFEFNNSRKGTGGTAGNYCWSIDGNAEDTDSSDDDTFRARCGAAVDNTIGFNKSKKHQLFDPSNGNALGCIYQSTTPTTSYSVNVMQGYTTSNLVDCQLNRNGTHMLGLQTFNAPVTITPSTASIDMGFRLENTFGISFSNTVVGDLNTEYVQRFTLGGFEFKVVPN